MKTSRAGRAVCNALLLGVLVMCFSSRVRSCAVAHTHRDRLWLDLGLQMLDGGALAAVELVSDLAAQLYLALLDFRGLHERRAAGRTDRCLGDRPRPLADPLGIRNAELEQAVVRPRVLEDVDPAEIGRAHD